MTRARVVVVGSLNMDLVALVPEFPGPGETITGTEFLRVHGGKGANQAVAAARLGCDVTMVGRVGDDHYGSELLSGLTEDNIDVGHVGVSSDASSGIAVVAVSTDGENQIIVIPGANGKVTRDDVAAAEDAIAAADVLLLQFEVPMDAVERAATIAQRHGTIVVVNPAPAVTMSSQLLSHTDVLVPNETEAALLAGVPEGEHLDPLDTAHRLAALGTATVVVTRGPSGVAIVHDRECWLESPFIAEAVVDTTGAGDSFVGGLSTALGEGRTVPDAVKWGMASGALAVAKPGAQVSMPRRDEVQAVVASQRGTDEEMRS